MDFALSIVNRDGKLVVDSREVAKVVEMRHADLLSKINGYNEILLNGKFRSMDYFVPSDYKDSIGRTLPCYLLTKQGCEMVANKLTGEKGVLFTAAYVQQFNAMQEKMSAQQTQLMTPTQMLRLQLEAMENLEKAQKEQNERLDKQEQRIDRVTEALTAFKPSTGNWSEDMRNRITDLSKKSGVYHEFIYKEIYYDLEHAAHVRLKQRVNMKKKRLSAAGAKAARINAVTRLSIIEEDTQLRLIFEKYLHEMEVRYAMRGEGKAN